MRAFPEFIDMSSEFWVFVKFVSEMLGYAVRRKGMVRTYTEDEISKLCREKNTYVSNRLIRQAVHYFDMRAELLNLSLIHIWSLCSTVCFNGMEALSVGTC